MKSFKKQDFKKVEIIEDRNEKDDFKGETSTLIAFEEKNKEDEANYHLANEILASIENTQDKEELKNKNQMSLDAEWNLTQI